MTKRHTHTGISLAVTLALLTLCTSQAFAGAIIMDDDLFPTNAIPASVAAAQQAYANRHTPPASRPTPAATYQTAQLSAAEELGDSYTVLFRKGIWGLNDEGAAAVTDLLPLMQGGGKKIIITGRPDNLPNNNLANQRAQYLRTWLMRRGIPGDQIETRVKDATNIPVNGQFPVDIQIVAQPTTAYRPQAAQQPAQQPALPTPTRAQQRTPSYTYDEGGIRTTVTPLTNTPPNPTTTVAILATPNPDARLETVRQIATAAQAGRIDPKAALATIIEILGSPHSASAPMAASAPAKPAPGAEFGLQAATETARPKDWLLSSAGTLKDNVSTWAKSEGYEVDWRAANYYKVGRDRTLSGDLFPTIEKIADSVGLDIGIWKKDRLIRICDKNDSACKPGASSNIAIR